MPSARPVVMLIDDEPLVRETLQAFFIDEGYGTMTASDGEEALALLAAVTPRPDVIILDLTMPRVDGWQFLERRATEPSLATIPVVVLTALPNADVGGATVLHKPIRLDQLGAVVGKVVGAATLDQEGR
jgi:CheY-like chemotaxis protein